MWVAMLIQFPYITANMHKIQRYAKNNKHAVLRELPFLFNSCKPVIFIIIFFSKNTKVPWKLHGRKTC